MWRPRGWGHVHNVHAICSNYNSLCFIKFYICVLVAIKAPVAVGTIAASIIYLSKINILFI
jgi:hypothetical protein